MTALRWPKLRVLIVDGDETNLAAVKSVLRSVKVWMVRNTDSLAGALHILEDFPADLALVNLQLPATDGLELASGIRACDGQPYTGIPILLMLDEPDKDLLRRAMGVGVDKMVRTPFSRETLLKQIAALMADRQRRVRTVPAKAAKPAAEKPPAKPVTARQRTAAPADTGGPRWGSGGGTVLPAEAAAKEAKASEPLETAAASKKKHAPKKEGGPDIPQVLDSHATWLKTRGRDGERATLAKADLHGADLGGADLGNANLRGAVLSDANCAGARFASADLRQVDFSGSDINEGDLAVANMRHANLKATRLDNAVLRQADLAGVTFAGASLKGTDLAGANLLEADLRGADLRETTGLTRAQLSKARGDHTTLLPPTVWVSWSGEEEAPAPSPATED